MKPISLAKRKCPAREHTAVATLDARDLFMLSTFLNSPLVRERAFDSVYDELPSSTREKIGGLDFTRDLSYTARQMEKLVAKLKL